MKKSEIGREEWKAKVIKPIQAVEVLKPFMKLWDSEKDNALAAIVYDVGKKMRETKNRKMAEGRFLVAVSYLALSS